MVAKTIKKRPRAGPSLHLKTLRRSHTKQKKWDAVFVRSDGSMHTVPFGQRGYSDYTKHHDTQRRNRYIARHAHMHENWSDPETPGALSRFVLWNRKTLKASLQDFRRRFHV